MALALAVVLSLLAAGIVVTQRQSRSHLLSSFALRGTTSATFVSTFIQQQAERERQAGEALLAQRRVRAQNFQAAVSAFGGGAAVLVDSGGRALAIAPSDPALVGRQIASRYAHLRAAEQGRVAVSNVVPSAARGLPVAAIAVPFSSAAGRRVFSVAYNISGTALASFVDHTIAYRQHNVYLVDGAGKLLAASPDTAAATLSAANPALARAAGRSGVGSLADTTFTVAPIPNTDWRIVIAVSDSRLFASIGGWAEFVPWIVFAIVCVFALTLLVLFRRLAALSARMADSARTDSLTGLANRRALDEHITRACDARAAPAIGSRS